MQKNAHCRRKGQFRQMFQRLAAFVVAALPLLVMIGVSGSALAAPEGEEAALRAHSYRMAGDANRMRVVIEFDREPPLKWFLLRGPHRLVLDLPDTAFGFDSDALDPRGLITKVRYGRLGEGHSRVILASDGPFVVEKLALLENETSPGNRMVLDLVSGSERQFEDALADQAQITGSTTIAGGKRDRLAATQREEEGGPFTVVIDPGHGGIDGGAEGANGTVEKELTLSFARELRKALEAEGGYEVVMTRDEDVFLRLDERVRVARQHEADLFISVHADTIRYRSIRGATVYTISEKASDEVARAAAERENESDSLAGVEVAEENREVAGILADLVRRETHGFSVSFARSLVSEFSETIELIKNPHRSAGFRVLRAPDVPSVLVELGYLSNPEDEALMLDGDWRKKAVTSIIEAVGGFAAATGKLRG